MLHLYDLVVFIKCKQLCKLVQSGSDCDGSLHCVKWTGASVSSLGNRTLSEIPFHSMANAADSKVHPGFCGSDCIEHMSPGLLNVRKIHRPDTSNK